MIPEKQRYENLEKFTPDVVGRYDIPVIKADKVYFSGVIGFNYAATAKDRAAKAAFLRGDEAMCERLSPSEIIFYGSVPDECRGNIIHIKSFQDKFREAMTCGR